MPRRGAGIGSKNHCSPLKSVDKAVRNKMPSFMGVIGRARLLPSLEMRLGRRLALPEILFCKRAGATWRREPGVGHEHEQR